MAFCSNKKTKFNWPLQNLKMGVKVKISNTQPALTGMRIITLQATYFVSTQTLFIYPWLV